MLIVDAQVHIWSAGPPTNPSHRQVTSYTAEECIRDMDAAGVDACLLHPPGWDPNSGKISEEAAAKYPNRFAILGEGELPILHLDAAVDDLLIHGQDVHDVFNIEEELNGFEEIDNFRRLTAI